MEERHLVPFCPNCEGLMELTLVYRFGIKVGQSKFEMAANDGDYGLAETYKELEAKGELDFQDGEDFRADVADDRRRLKAKGII